jgi:Dockerin type I domain
MIKRVCRSLGLRSAFAGVVAVLMLAGAGGLDAQPPTSMNPPALPANPPGDGVFGTALTGAAPPPPSFPNPNNFAWTPLGPATLTEGGGSASGRIAGVAVDPTNSNVIYIAAAGGGVWKSVDGGASYIPQTDSQGTLAMGAIAVAPSNSQRIYAGTGEANNSGDSNFGLGMLVSTNGGATWTLSTGPGGVFNRQAFSKISVHPTNELIAYAAVNDFSENSLCCANTGIYKTTDGGSTWVNVTAPNGNDALYPWSDVVVDPNTPTIIYAAHGDPFNVNGKNGVYRSLDSGSTWTVLTNAPHGANGRIALAIAPSANTANNHVLYVAVATALGSSSVLFQMLRSDNADATTPTFTNLTTTPNFGGDGGQGWYDWIIGVDPSNSANIYCAGAITNSNQTNHVIRSVNSGATWIDITTVPTVGGIKPHTDSHGMAFDSLNRLLLGNDGGIWRFDPSVPSWTNLNGNLNTIQFTGIGLHPTTVQNVIGGSQDNGTELTTGSAQWNATDGGDGGYSQFSQTNPLIVYSNHPIGSFGAANFFRVSVNGGTSWASRTPPGVNPNIFNFYAPIFVDPSNGARVFMGGDKLYESTTTGTSWTGHTSPSATTAIDSVAVLPGGMVIYVSTGGTFATSSQIWFSNNDGTSWTQRSLPSGNGRVQEIDIDPNDNTGNTAVAVINTFNGANGQIFRTINGGVLWTNISGNAPAVPTWSAKIDTNASKTLYISNETGVYSSPSPYGAWTPVGTGLPHAQGVSLQLNSSLHELALGTHGRGAFFFSTLISPTLAKAFSPASITSGGTSTVTVTLNNPNSSALTNGSFTDTLTNMSAVGGAVGGTCVGTTPNSLSVGATSLGFSGITIPASSNCTVTFDVTSTHLGVNPNTAAGLTTTEIPQPQPPSNTANLTVTPPPPTVVSYNVICGSACTFNMLTSSRTRLPWQVTGIQVVFSQVITSADASSLTGVSATGFSGLGTNTLTWTFTGATNANIASALATSGPHAISSAGGTLTGANTSFALKILEGDMNDDGIVNAPDLTLVNNARSQPYNQFADINGDGGVTTADVLIVRALGGQSNP